MITVVGFDSDGEPVLSLDSTGVLRIHFCFMPPSGGGPRKYRDFVDQQMSALLARGLGKKVRRDDREVFLLGDCQQADLHAAAAFLEHFWTRTAPVEYIRAQLRAGRRAQAFGELKTLGHLPKTLRQSCLKLHAYEALQQIPELLTEIPSLNVYGEAHRPALPAGIAQCTGLTQLAVHDMTGLDLAQLADQLAGLPKLKKLSLWGCQVPEFPPNLRQLAGLRELFCNGCQVEALSPVLLELPKLREVVLWNERALKPSRLAAFRKKAKVKNITVRTHNS